MNAVNTSTDKIIQQIETTKKEIEQFLDELSLDETTAEDQLSKIKEELRSSVKEIKIALQEKGITKTELAIQSKLSELEAHLEKTRDTPSTIDLFLSSIKRIIKDVSKAVDDNPLNEILRKTNDQLLIYKLKFEILRLKVAMGKLKVQYTGKEIQHQLTEKIHALSQFVRESKYETGDKLRKLRRMTSKIYSDISKLYA